MISIDKWGKDHWSLLAYIETCCVDHNGHFNLMRIRVNPSTHPLLAVGKLSPRRWEPSYGTRLNDGTELPQHDDVDCLDDLSGAGMIFISSLVNAHAVLSPLGIVVAEKLRKHKIEGGKYGEFKIR